jgi:hypothetical protein
MYSVLFVITNHNHTHLHLRTQDFAGGGSTNSVEDEGQRNGDLCCSPYTGIPLNLQVNEARILIGLLRMHIPRNWEFGSGFSILRNFGEGVQHPNPHPSVRHCSPINNTFQCHYGTWNFYLRFRLLLWSSQIYEIFGWLGNCECDCYVRQIKDDFQLLLWVEMNCRFVCVIFFILVN